MNERLDKRSFFSMMEGSIPPPPRPTGKGAPPPPPRGAPRGGPRPRPKQACAASDPN